MDEFKVDEVVNQNDLQVVEETSISPVVYEEKKKGLGGFAKFGIGVAVTYGVVKGVKWLVKKVPEWSSTKDAKRAEKKKAELEAMGYTVILPNQEDNATDSKEVESKK